MELCPKCNKEIFTYLKTGGLREKKDEFLITYNLLFCVNCKIVWYQEHEKYVMKDLKYEQEKRNKAKEKMAKEGIGKKVK
ncbi:MAG: hypothetical protein US52_C0053G0021 [candidate division WS6 bacterium GW2011_GWA2_37_6]|uniref:Uncharacterized protein n=1 Tax=candidate division WS6 bacterium GW2011_GWA2_37_6 TaxID=1619087 RepID=A0A0G0GUC0_9BACT|nr:MAG: hypothetical protein US52_C0053G0021 [candidate division WS6 bacterium GW2011_GWA2_37_6]